MMATLDLLCEQGLPVRCAVDLGGTVLAGGEVLSRVFAAVGAAQPRVTFLNAFMQTALCDEFARMLLDAHLRKPLSGRIVVRLKGRNADIGRDLLARQGFEVYEDLAPAIQALVGSAEPARTE
jgi:succinyl-CoA synthetase beta subunit